jgi:hypothetical protein
VRAYHRVDPLMDERKSHYTPAQLGAFLKVQLVAGRQKYRGRFRSLDALRAALPRDYAKLVTFLVDEGDLAVCDDGSVYVPGWDEWQEGNLPVADRMAAIRARTPSTREGFTSPMPKERSTGAERTRKWRLRTHVFERDHHTCRYCGRADYPRGWLIAEHVIPDGPTTIDNLVTACRPCNSRKGPRTPAQAGMVLLPVPSDGEGPRDVSPVTSRDEVLGVRSSNGVHNEGERDGTPVGAREPRPVNP